VLLAVLLFAYGRTLGSYFLADDFSEIANCANIFSGDLSVFWSTLKGNYLNVPNMSVWRPCLLVSLLFDYGIWKTNALGYYITNLLYMLGAAWMFYIVLRALTTQWGELESMVASLFAAASFISNPLHCESISYVVGRVDVLCAFFYLVSYWCFIKRGSDENPRWLIGGIIAFWLAMLTKEMAIGLPLLLFATAYVLPELFLRKRGYGIFAGNSSTSYSSRERFEIACKTSAVLWINTVAYFILRLIALGTVTGGYVGSIGASQFSHIFEKWGDFDTLMRIFYPLNSDVFGQGKYEHTTLNIFYFVFAALLICRVVILGAPWRWLALMLAWIFSTLLPIYQLWGLSENLAGSRFVFFLTMPLAAIAPFLILAPPRLGRGGEFVMLFTRRVLPISAEAFALFVIFSCMLTYKNNIPWIHAGKETRACQREAISLASHLRPNQKEILLGIPKKVGGAPMILNGITLECMLNPPYTSSTLANRFLLFDPILYDNPELINVQRLKESLAQPETQGIYVWNSARSAFQSTPPIAHAVESTNDPIEISFPTSSGIQALPYAPDNGEWHEVNGVLNIRGSEKGSALAIAPLKVNPYSYDFVEFDLKRQPCGRSDQAKAFWSSEADPYHWHDLEAPASRNLPCPVQKTGKGIESTHFRVPLSNHWSWFTGGLITRVQVKLPAEDLTVANLKLVSSDHLVPKLRVDGLAASNLGVYSFPQKLSLIVDGSQIDNCAAVQLLLSKANFFFDNLPEESLDEVVKTRFKKAGKQARFEIKKVDLADRGFYQLRAICLDERGHEVGEHSSEVTIKY
jgi:hypothetical protein